MSLLPTAAASRLRPAFVLFDAAVTHSQTIRGFPELAAVLFRLDFFTHFLLPEPGTDGEGEAAKRRRKEGNPVGRAAC